MASVSYRIEGPRETLEKINDAILKAMPNKEHWDEWEACRYLGFTEEELDSKRLGGEILEEPGCEVYATNDKEGKYFPERYYCELCLDDQIDTEYFKTEEDMFQWLFKKTDGRVKNWQNVDDFNSDYEDEALDDENYIIIHQFDVCD